MTSVPRVDNKKNPRPFASRGFLSKSVLTSTNAYGAANYDDDQQPNLSNNL
jgi:hypothetical protein